VGNVDGQKPTAHGLNKQEKGCAECGANDPNNGKMDCGTCSSARWVRDQDASLGPDNGRSIIHNIYEEWGA
jgi:hypothetical protein